MFNFFKFFCLIPALNCFNDEWQAPKPAQLIFMAKKNNLFWNFDLNLNTKNLFFIVYYQSSSGGASNNSIYVLNHNLNKVQNFPTLNNNKIQPWLVKSDNLGNTYIGTFTKGLYTIKPSSLHPVQDPRFPETAFLRSHSGSWVSALDVSRQRQNLYVGYNYNAFYELTVKQGIVYKFNNGPFGEGTHINYITTSPQGDVWAVSSYGGIGVINHQTGKTAVIVDSHGHPLLSVFGENFLISFDAEQDAFIKNNVVGNKQIYEVKAGTNVAFPIAQTQHFPFASQLNTMAVINNHLLYFSAAGNKGKRGFLFVMRKNHNIWTQTKVDGLPADVSVLNLKVLDHHFLLVNTKNHGAYYVDLNRSNQEQAIPISGIPSLKLNLWSFSNQPKVFASDQSHQFLFLVNANQVYKLNLKTWTADLVDQTLARSCYAQQIITIGDELIIGGQNHNGLASVWMKKI